MVAYQALWHHTSAFKYCLDHCNLEQALATKNSLENIKRCTLAEHLRFRPTSYTTESLKRQLLEEGKPRGVDAAKGILLFSPMLVRSSAGWYLQNIGAPIPIQHTRGASSRWRQIWCLNTFAASTLLSSKLRKHTKTYSTCKRQTCNVQTSKRHNCVQLEGNSPLRATS